MKCATQCVFCNQPIEPETQPTVLIKPQEDEQTGEAYAHFRCYGNHELRSEVDGDS